MVSATDSVATFLNSAVNRAERRQQAVELVVDAKEGTLSLVLDRAGVPEARCICRTGW